MKFGKKPFYRRKRKVIEMVQYNYIRFLYFNKHKSQRAISKEMGIYKESYFSLKS
jgi:DNA-binding transcriptional regulator LsrR (DeoR family)